MNPATIARLAEERKAWGMSRADVAEIVSVHPDTLEKFENGTRSPSLGTLTRWADSLGMDVVLQRRD